MFKDRSFRIKIVKDDEQKKETTSKPTTNLTVTYVAARAEETVKYVALAAITYKVLDATEKIFVELAKSHISK
jgi:hypothetical protein